MTDLDLPQHGLQLLPYRRATPPDAHKSHA
jgi:hypothetical protein